MTKKHFKMKTIVNKLRFALLLGFVAIGMTALAQAISNNNKISITTQMFLDEMAGRISFEEEAPGTRGTTPGVKPLPKPRRPIASPDTIDGKVYIAATVRIASERDLAVLESKGVIIQCKFDKGLVTTLLPIDKIDEIAAIEGVSRINVSAIMTPLTNLGRQTTNVDDVLTLSNDAINAGLEHIYDGSGVILGVIDDGIDFQHKAFQDKNGNTRIKGAYCYNGSSVTADWTGSGTLPTTDDTAEDHGTHTSTTAGGSSVIVSGTNVTVTDNHANATYGGMAPGADLFLAGTQLYTNYILNAFQKMSNYADQQGKPLVVSNSWGSSLYARDGYSDMSDVLNQYFGGNKKNRICLFASGNEAGMAIGGEGGGRWVTGTASQASPLGTILRTTPWIESYGYQYYSGWLANAWTRGTNCTGIGINIYVINKTTGAISNTYNYTSTNSSGTYTTVTLGSINMSVRVYFDYVESNNKHQVALRATNYKTTSNYVIAIEVYPIGGNNSTVDIYGGDYTYLTGYLTTNGHNWQNGSDDQSMGDEPMDPNVISIGSYVTRNGANSTGDISDFSSYATEGSGPTGVMHPWITAPGEVIISGINHYVSNHDGTVTVNNSTAPYGEMSGTSMAAPAAAGIVALWFQAAQEVGMDLTLNDVKEIMKETAIRDSWVTNGANSSHFGHGKINALAGIEYILGDDPVITANPAEVTFSGEPGNTYTQTVSIGGRNLIGNITATLNDDSGVFSISTTNLGQGGNLIITYSPTVEAEQTATIVLTSDGAEPVTITISASSFVIGEETVCDGQYVAQTLPLLGLYHDEDQHNQMIYPARKFENTTMSGKKLKSMTFYPTNGQVTQSGTTYNFTGLNFYNGSVTFKLANLPSGSQGFNADAPEFVNATLTEVKTIQMPSAADPSVTAWTINFDEGNEFVYSGGDLLIDVSNVPGNWGYTFFQVDTILNMNPGYVTYVSDSFTTDYLPTVTFEWYDNNTAGTVSPTELEFNYVTIGKSYSETVTITNTGNQPFTPVIDTSGLPQEFTVSGSGELLPNGTLDLTVTYSPTDEGPHSGSFTVTIGDQTYTVTVSGYAAEGASTIYSNHEQVLVFKSEAQAIDAIAYQVSDIDNDTKHLLPISNEDGDVSIQVVGNSDITRYDLNRQSGSSSWSVVAVANHNGNDYTQQGYSDNTVTVADGATAWMNLIDDAGITSTEATYVPVTHALSVQQNDNTYGAPRQTKTVNDLSAIVQYIEMSSEYQGGQPWTENGNIYTHYTILLDIDKLIIPTSEIDPTKDYDLYMVRAWRQVDPSLLNERYYEASTGNAGKNREERLTEDGEFLFEELGYDTYSLSSVNNLNNQYYLGNNSDLESYYPNWTSPGSYEVMATFGAQKLRENDEETGVIESLPMVFTVRAYYTRTANLQNNAGGGTRDGESAADGKYYILEYTLPLTLTAGDPNIHTAVGSIFTDRQVVGVTYVNAMGMQSNTPFDGINIVVTRYSDGTTSTTKVLK